MLRAVRTLLPFASLLFIMALLAIWEPDSFLTTGNFLTVFQRSSIFGLLALGMTLVIISGGIDLSVGAMMAFVAMLSAQYLQTGNPSYFVAILIGLGAGTLCGLLNGVLITALKLQPFIVTLGTMSLFRGLALVWNDGEPYNTPGFAFLGETEVFGITLPIWILIGGVLLFGFILRYTLLGRYTYALGSNERAAFHAGINVDKTKVWIYSLAGALTGLAAMIAMSRTVSAQPNTGVGYELDVIAAVVLGGASLSGGVGSITGTLVGTLLIQFLTNGCTLIGISTNAQKIVIGVIIVIAVTIDQLLKKSAANSSEN